MQTNDTHFPRKITGETKCGIVILSANNISRSLTALDLSYYS